MELQEPQENYITGYIKIYRSIINHWLWIEKPYSKFEAWVFLLLRANHAKGKINIGFELFEIERGQFISSQEKLSEQFGWNRNQVRSYLSLLEADKMIKIETHTKFTKITICNYDTYQSRLPSNQQPIDNDLTTTLQPIDNDLTQTRIINNDNNVDNDNKYNETEKNLLNSEIWHEQVGMACRLKDTTQVKEWVKKFIIEAKAKEQFFGKSLKELKSYCVSWIKLELSKEAKGFTKPVDEVYVKPKQKDYDSETQRLLSLAKK